MAHDERTALRSQSWWDGGPLDLIGHRSQFRMQGFPEDAFLGRPIIGVAVEVSERHVRIAVQDNGLGIPAREHKRIFQKFYRVDDRLSRAKEGSGLGLAIAKHVVKAHRGHIELTSALGRGSVFTIVLPIPRMDRVPALEAPMGKA